MNVVDVALQVRFEDPAPHAPRSVQTLIAFSEILRAHPGQWALLGQLKSSSYARHRAYQIRNALQGGRNPAFGPAGAFEAEARTLFGEHRIYVRYVGGEAP